MTSTCAGSSQVEIQLGHLCNNRCVFCVSGLETALKRAHPMPVEPLVAEVERAFAMGHRRITLLGGEPTLQPGFLDVVRAATRLGFEEIVVFSNGAKTAREGFIDEILAIGGPISWRLSFQGGNREAHERTTRKPGSFERLTRTLASLRARGQKITVNMCVVQSNYASVPDFGPLLLPFGVKQLHLDMVRPLDAGDRTEQELRDMIPRYSDMVPALEAMIDGFPRGFDVNIGNLPYCVAPHLAPWIHHDGEHTMTVAIDNEASLSAPWDKYETKRRDKIHVESCSRCVFRPRCNGVFETYAEFYGVKEIEPVTLQRLLEIDPQRELFFELHLSPILEQWRKRRDEIEAEIDLVSNGKDEVTLSLRRADGDALVVSLRRDGQTHVHPTSLIAANRLCGGYVGFSVHRVSVPRDKVWARRATQQLRELFAAFDVVHAVGDDLIEPIPPTLSARLGRLRQRAPFGELRWQNTRVLQGGRRIEIDLLAASNERATLWLEERGGKPAGGYLLDGGTPSAAIVTGLRAAMQALGVIPS